MLSNLDVLPRKPTALVVHLRQPRYQRNASAINSCADRGIRIFSATLRHVLTTSVIFWRIFIFSWQATPNLAISDQTRRLPPASGNRLAGPAPAAR